MRIGLVAIVCIAALLSGCASRNEHMVDPVSSASDRDEINRALAWTSVRMTFVDGGTESGVFLSVAADSTTLAHAEGATTRIVVPTASVRSVTLLKRGGGGAKGLGCCAATGALAVGAVAVAMLGTAPDAGGFLLIGAGAAALVALPFGLLFGATSGEEHVYNFAVHELAPPGSGRDSNSSDGSPGPLPRAQPHARATVRSPDG